MKLDNRKAIGRLETALGISYSTSSEAPATLDENVLLASVERLRAADEESREYLVALLASMGFTVLTWPGWGKGQVMLPVEYGPAIRRLAERQKDKQEAT